MASILYIRSHYLKKSSMNSNSMLERKGEIYLFFLLTGFRLSLFNNMCWNGLENLMSYFSWKLLRFLQKNCWNLTAKHCNLCKLLRHTVNISCLGHLYYESVYFMCLHWATPCLMKKWLKYFYIHILLFYFKIFDYEKCHNFT